MMSWRKEEGIRSRKQVVVQLDITSVRTSSEERGLVQVRPSEVMVGEGASWMSMGADVSYFLGKLQSSPVREEGGGGV